MVLNRSKSMYMPCIEIWMLIWQVKLLMKFLQDLFSFFFSTLGWNLFFLFLFFELELWSNCCWIVTSTWIGIQVLVLLIEPIQWAWPKSLSWSSLSGNMNNTFLHSQAKEFSNLSGWCLAGWMIVVFLQLI